MSILHYEIGKLYGVKFIDWSDVYKTVVAVPFTLHSYKIIMKGIKPE